MMYKNQLIVFMISSLIAGFFVLSTAELGFTGFEGVCCKFIDQDSCEPAPSVCEDFGGTPCATTESCVGPGPCTCIPPPIPTLNQWGMIITAGVLGLFAVIGIFAMRGRKVTS